MKKAILIIYFLSIASCLNAQAIINEVMYAPISPAKEWFEIYNNGLTDIDLQNWKWRDAAPTNPVRTIVTQSIILPPGSFAVICEDLTNFKSVFPGINGIIIQSIGWNALNNTGNENIVLYNSLSQVIDSLTYNNTWGGSKGFSLERINPSEPTNDKNNWGTSINPNKGTPNYHNSITPKQYNLILHSFSITPSFPSAGDSINFRFVISNIGLNSANNFSLNIYNDINFDSIPQTTELMFSKNYSSLIMNQGDSLISLYSVQNIDSGYKQYIGKIIYPQDEDTSNNMLIRNINVSGTVSTTGLIINEIMYVPQSPEPEWIELLNNSSNQINIKNWKIADSTTQINPVSITPENKYINPGDYLVIAKNNSILTVHNTIDTNKIIYLSALPSFNNDCDEVIIYNSANIKSDQVSYKSSWGGSSRNSLERISPNRLSCDSTNWTTSLDCEHSSPARQNSVVNLIGYSRNDLVINEIMYDPLVGNSEWVELYNPTYKYLNLTGWKFSILSNAYNLFDTCDYFLKPNGFLIFATDSTLFSRFPDLKIVDSSRKILFNHSISLSNGGTPIKILDATNNLIDSVYYNPKWHNGNIPDPKGYSLEKINPLLGSNDKSNWNSCTAPLGGTPGTKNSIFTQNQIPTSNLSVSPNPFSPDGDGFEDFTIIKYNIKSRIAQLRVKVFDVKGRLVRTLVNNQLSGNEGQIIFDGKNDDGEKLRIGIYILFLEAIDDRGGTVEQIKSTVVVATKL
jgi:hypothetical protein